MAPITRSQTRQTTPKRPIRTADCSTKTRIEFFHDYDTATPSKTLARICKPFQIDRRTGRRWLHQRRELGSPAIHRMRTLSTKIGRPSRVSKDVVKMLVSPSQNKVRDQALEAQIEFHDINVQRRQLTRRLAQDTQGARRYKMAFSKSSFTQKNIDCRRQHGQKYAGKTIEDTYQFWLFSDEAHFDSSAQQAGFILREEGTRLEPENIQMRGNKTGIVLHVAAGAIGGIWLLN